MKMNLRRAEILVIGGGPGGYSAAIRASQLGKRVILIEKDQLGGVCLNRGCIPSKALLHAAEVYDHTRNLTQENIGIISSSVSLDFTKVQDWKKGIIDRLNQGVGQLISSNQIDCIQGSARFISPDTVIVLNEVGTEVERVSFDHCILAVGSVPMELKSFPFGGRIFSSTELLNLPHLPNRLIVIGGGYIGTELGQAFAKMGCKVTLLEGAERILPAFDHEMVRLVQRRLTKLNVDTLTGATAISYLDTAEGISVTYSKGNDTQRLTADYVLVAVGRRPNIASLQLIEADVRLDTNGLVAVDSQCRTSNPRIYAIGDITAGPALAHKASFEGKVAAEVIAGKSAHRDNKAIPAVVYTDPELATVGVTKQEADERGLPITIGKFSYAANGRALTLNEAEGFVRLIADQDTKQLLGAQIAGEGASELIGELAVAIELGASAEHLASTIHAHPTLSEMIMEAAEDVFGLAIHHLSKRSMRERI